MRWRRWQRGLFENLATALMRGAERLLPPWALAALLWPSSAITALAWLTYRMGHLPLLRRLQGRPSLLALWVQRTRMEMVRPIGYWRDRLVKPRWKERCRIEGLGPPAGKPMVLVMLHYGPIYLLMSILRAHGHPASVLVNLQRLKSVPAGRQRINRLEDEGNGFGAVPRLISSWDILEARDHLRSGGLLIVAADGREGRRIRVQAGEFTASLGHGFLRLAQAAGAEVRSCVIRADGGLSCTCRVGPPLPPGMVEQRDRHEEACARLLGEVLEEVGKAPGQCRHLLLQTLEGAAEKKARSAT